MNEVDKIVAGEKLAVVIKVALTISEAEADAIATIARRQESVMPLLDPTRWCVEGEGISATRRIAESFSAFRRLLADTPAGRAIAAAEGAGGPEIIGQS